MRGHPRSMQITNSGKVPSNGTIWLVPDKSVRQFHHADFGAAANLNLGVVADPFHLRNKQHVYVNVARFTTAREKRRKHPTFHLTILNVRTYFASMLRLTRHDSQGLGAAS